MSQQGYRQQTVREITGTDFSYDGDWQALFDLNGIPQGDSDGRLLQWLSLELGVTYTNLPEAMQTFAELNGACNWSSMGLFNPAATGSALLMETGDVLLTEAGDQILLG